MTYIPEEAKEIINNNIESLEAVLPDFLESYHIYGSISLGAFNTKESDIDFIAITKRKAMEKDIDILKNLHINIKKKFPKKSLDGMYLFKDDIEALNKKDSPCLRFNDGNFEGIVPFLRDSIDAFQLKKYGINIKGQSAKSLDYSVNFNILINNMYENLNTYWLNWMNKCKKFPSMDYINLLVNLKEIEWGVLGVSRLYYTFLEKDMTSKVGAGEYALKVFPQRWHKIINESMRLRKGVKTSYYSSLLQRRNDAIAYMDFVIGESNKGLSQNRK
ncbi:aminoglycoside adenylyltransferase domain-containing protein [Clostridium cellulovorans]|uniref:Adenylyltransferase AadA C-terminal domain-containing protein n=1 Tax=Clostridium cellulovorans (strain ATCC 35296 / DSM 3052 / OCM 3 / 743B) TaxID=573061 RepID=D9SPM2_CLOC7|nr:aminoglycoside adenylyltransferase domain-containing protein [Clostridium cellulovorans]ADL50071.1 hypothetical protein Clocel_0290 [Clostridium cellulovorans 743B]